MEMQWDKLHNWNIMTGCYRSFRRNKQDRRHGGVALLIKKWIDCEELPLRNSHEQVESLRVKVRDWTNKGHLVVRVYYRSPD